MQTTEGQHSDSAQQLLTPQALKFIYSLERKFGPTRQQLLAKRQQRQKAFDQGEKPDFLPDTVAIRQGEWKAGPIPPDLQDRRVEITGPVNRKMVINALNSGAKVFMADFEDSNSPTWDNCLQGQINLIDAVRGTIDYRDPKTHKHYKLNDNPAVLIVRPRGWHLDEAHLQLDDKPISASLFDFGLYLFHNAEALLNKGTAPYFYLPKMQSHLEARLWNEVFEYAEQYLELPPNSIKATVLIETLPAAFEMDEIIYELKDRIVGLNCGRWDYIFSFIKSFRHDADCLMPDRQLITMTCPFLQSYVDLLIQTCHRRGIHAMGGMAAQIPIKGDDEANQIAMDKVRADKLREVKAGHDGTWVAHPDLIPIAREVFDAHMPTPNQINRKERDKVITAQALLQIPQGPITLQGIKNNLSVGIQYLAAWLGGNGCVPINHLMEDAATGEICRAQLWQWLHANARLQTGEQLTPVLFKQLLQAEMDRIGPIPYLHQAADLLSQMIQHQEFDEFLTIPAYANLIKGESHG